jgi:hypothetical protein
LPSAWDDEVTIDTSVLQSIKSMSREVRLTNDEEDVMRMLERGSSYRLSTSALTADDPERRVTLEDCEAADALGAEQRDNNIVRDDNWMQLLSSETTKVESIQAEVESLQVRATRRGVSCVHSAV